MTKRLDRRSSYGSIITEYLVVLITLMAIWLTSDVVLNAMNTYYSGFVNVISAPTGGDD